MLYQVESRYRYLLRHLGLDEAAVFAPSFNASRIPADAQEYLRRDNPRLQTLIRRYRDLNHPVLAHSMWTEDYVDREVNLQYFRGDQAFVWQMRDLNMDLNYLVTLQYLKALDDRRLFDSVVEDGLFGVRTVTIEGTVVSRDLLDSINEFYFLERSLQLSSRTDFNILDIGAGYGRLGYRFMQALPEFGRVFCVDAVAVSTFLCEYYLRFRQVNDRASAIPLDELDALLSHQRIDLAINVCSFSECSLASIGAWLDILAANDVRYLFIVPGGGSDRGASLLCNVAGSPDGPQRECRDFAPLIAARGYELRTREPKFRDALVQQDGVSPTHYYLFERALR